ncbi:SDR family NAD(P)-dependent oxidoreductase [Streptomyces sp. NPDC058430]|uniref:SDR family NAD(P)-dependent oxidoreductase n=1 Tax=Streptomyces sp. NPDC058430 TaxID=3346495 RepID=UPI00365456D0
MRLQGKTAVVTGGSSGIGRAMVERFVREGARVLIVDRDGETARKAAAECSTADADGRPTVEAIAGDVGEPGSWDQVRAHVTEQWGGRLDILVNNAGYGIKATVTETSLEDWHAIVSTNVTGVFLGSRTAVELMRATEGGSIVNIASVAGQIGMVQRAAYCSTKAAVVGLTKAMSLDHAKEGIRVNCVSPGTVDSPYFQKIAAHLDDPVAYRQALADRQPVGRMGTPEEIAAAVAFLAADESSYATGSVLTMDGGMSVW